MQKPREAIIQTIFWQPIWVENALGRGDNKKKFVKIKFYRGDGIEIFTLSDLNAFTVFLMIAIDPCFAGSALVDINLGGLLMDRHRFVKKPQSRIPVSFGGENEH